MSTFFSPHEYATVEKMIDLLRVCKVNYKESIYREIQIGGGLGSLDEEIRYEQEKVGERDAQRRPTVDEFISYFETRLKKSKELDGGLV